MTDQTASNAALQAAPTSVFRHEGDFWTLAFEHTVVRMNDMRGLGYIARLLTRPGDALHVLDLVAGATDHEDGPPRADAGMMAASGTTPESERARARVTLAIRNAVRRISERHPSLGYHLATALKTGTFCRYQAHPERPIRWEVSGGS